jgi:hypothetical protein
MFGSFGGFGVCHIILVIEIALMEIFGDDVRVKLEKEHPDY